MVIPVLQLFSAVFAGRRVRGIRGPAKAADLVRSLREEYVDEVQKVCVSSSIGIALYPDHGSSYEDLFKKADQSLYYVKQHGKDGFKICD